MLTIDVTVHEETKDGVIKRNWYLYMFDGHNPETMSMNGLIGVEISEQKANEIFSVYNTNVIPGSEGSNQTTYRVMWYET